MSKKHFHLNVVTEVNASNFSDIYDGLSSIGIVPEGYLKHNSKEKVEEIFYRHKNNVIEVHIDTDINECYFMIWSNRVIEFYKYHKKVDSNELIDEISLLKESLWTY